MIGFRGKIDGKVFIILGIVLVVTGVLTYVFNYERQTVTLTGQINGSHLTILEYHASSWDPFPHYVELDVKTQDPITIRVTFSGATMQTTTLNMKEDVEVIAVYPEETLKLSIENPDVTTGTVKSVLWCDSWIYSAFVQTSLRFVLILVGIYKKTNTRIEY